MLMLNKYVQNIKTYNINDIAVTLEKISKKIDTVEGALLDVCYK